MADATTFGRYKLIAELGHGGMADVFLAVQAGPVGSGFSKLTVVKCLRKNLAEEPEFVSMLVDEARIAARLNHPNVVQTNEIGEVDGQYFIAMEYLDGQPFHRIQHRLMQRAKEGQPPLVTMEQQLLILMDALTGLHHAHELRDYDGTPLGIVHRDITPHNIFVTYDGVTKVVDFGIAKAAGRSSETRHGVVKGKVRYMAPEQAVGENVDRRADIFAAGIMLWEIVAERRMWKDADEMHIVPALVAGDLPRLPAEVPEPLQRICQRALALRVTDRYETADELRSDIEQYLADSGRLIEARRKLAPSVAELFKDKRNAIRAVIDAQLSALSKPSGEFQAVAIPAAAESASALPTGPTPLAQPVVSITAPTVAESPAKPPPPVPRRRRGLLAAIVALTAVLGGVIVSGRFLPPRAQAAANDTSATPDDVKVLLTGPANAEVRIDDGPAQRLPMETKVHREDRQHALHFQAVGFLPKTQLVSFARDVALAADLTPESPVASNDEKKEKAAPTSTVARNTSATIHGSQPVVAAPPPPPPHVDTAATTAAPVATAATTAAPADKAKPAASGKGRLGIDNADPWK